MIKKLLKMIINNLIVFLSIQVRLKVIWIKITKKIYKQFNIS